MALGFRRLSIIDLRGGSQPIFNEDKSRAIIFNGEIYNFKPLRKELIDAGHTFTTKADTEVLLHGYEEWGMDGLLKKVRGMFAFVIWDDNTKTLYGAPTLYSPTVIYFCIPSNGILLFFRIIFRVTPENLSIIPLVFLIIFMILFPTHHTKKGL